MHGKARGWGRMGCDSWSAGVAIGGADGDGGVLCGGLTFAEETVDDVDARALPHLPHNPRRSGPFDAQGSRFTAIRGD